MSLITRSEPTVPHRRRAPTFAGLALALIAAATPAFAQDRPPAERQTLLDLAYVIGESHALRQACAGPSDQYWRSRMNELVQVETPDSAFAQQLAYAFNTGFSARQTAFPACTAKSRRQAEIDAAKGRELSATLASEMADDDAGR